ncbi:MAG: hypothetical protein U0805_11405 [Pirellulales bacterium]
MASKFKDNAGREWDLSVHALTCMAVKTETGIRIERLFADKCKLFNELAEDASLFSTVLWCMVSEDAAKLGVTKDQFLASLAGDAMYESGIALGRAVADFHRADQRAAMNKWLDKAIEAQNASVANAAAAIESVTVDEIVTAMGTTDGR